MNNKIAELHEVLHKHPETQDNDMRLLDTFWARERRQFINTQYEKMSTEVLLILGLLTNPKYLIVKRSLLQNRHHYLRGNTFIERKIKGGLNKRNAKEDARQLNFDLD